MSSHRVVGKQQGSVLPQENYPTTLATLLKDKEAETHKAPTGRRGIEQGESLSTLRVAARRAVSVNDNGYPIGQDHHRSKHTDDDVALMLDLVAEGMPYREIAEKFETSKGVVADYVSGRRRGQIATGQRVRLKR